MSRVLLLSYYFPPIGGAGAQRPAKLARYLTERGHDVVVVTGPGHPGRRWTPQDDTLLEDIPESVAVRRVPGPEPAPGRAVRIGRWLGIESPWDRWWIESAIKTGLETGPADVIFTVMSPYASAAASRRLAARLGAPWIADLGDPWALDEMIVYPTALHRAREVRRMGRLLGSAAAIVMTTPEAVRRIRKTFPALVDRPITSIPLGFDPADFTGDAADRLDQAFRIVHTGYLHTDLGRQQRRATRARRLLGGGARGVDILTRSHVFLLEAIERLVARDPDLRSTIEVHLAGVMSPSDREIAARSDVVRVCGYLPHRESIQLLRSADLLFLPMQGLPRGVRSTMVPGKTYEYLASERPILAAVPEGDARDILGAAGNARICEPADVEGLMTALAAELDRWRAGSPPPTPKPELVRRFEYPRLTREVEALIELVAG